MLVLAFAGAEHQFANGFAWIFPVLENQLHLLGDGHFDAVLAGKAQSSA